jgi:hypothetical protein
VQQQLRGQPPPQPLGIASLLPTPPPARGGSWPQQQLAESLDQAAMLGGSLGQEAPAPPAWDGAEQLTLQHEPAARELQQAQEQQQQYEPHQFEQQGWGGEADPEGGGHYQQYNAEEAQQYQPQYTAEDGQQYQQYGAEDGQQQYQQYGVEDGQHYQEQYNTEEGGQYEQFGAEEGGQRYQPQYGAEDGQQQQYSQQHEYFAGYPGGQEEGGYQAAADPVG